MNANQVIPHEQLTRVLVVDYSRMGAQLIENALRLKPEFLPSISRYSVNGLQEDLERFCPDVVLISVNRKNPLMASQLLRTCQCRANSVPTVLLLSLLDKGVVHDALKWGASAVLTGDDGLCDIYESLDAAVKRNAAIGGEILTRADRDCGLTMFMTDNELAVFDCAAREKEVN